VRRPRLRLHPHPPRPPRALPRRPDRRLEPRVAVAALPRRQTPRLDPGAAPRRQHHLDQHLPPTQPTPPTPDSRRDAEPPPLRPPPKGEVPRWVTTPEPTPPVPPDGEAEAEPELPEQPPF
jgi:hypothetical protein